VRSFWEVSAQFLRSSASRFAPKQLIINKNVRNCTKRKNKPEKREEFPQTFHTARHSTNPYSYTTTLTN